MAPRHKDYGTVEGFLEGITAFDRKRHSVVISVHDDVLNRDLICFLPLDQLDACKAALNKRVSVSGKIVYNAAGYPVLVKGETFSQFPDQETLPSFDNVRGMFAEKKGPHRAKKHDHPGRIHQKHDPLRPN